MRELMFVSVMIMALGMHVQSQTLRSESTDRPLVAGLSADYGFIIIHSRSLREIKNSYPWGIRADVSKHLLTKEAWSFCNCYPRVGGSLAYWNWDNPKNLGHGSIMLGYLEPYFITHRRTNIIVKVAFGAAFLTKPFDAETNPNNLSYSTRLNFAATLGAGLNYRLTSQMNLSVLAKYNHVSNGGFRTPNKGINYPTMSLGVSQSLTAIDFPALAKSSTRNVPKRKFRISFAHLSGWSNAAVADKKQYYVLGFAGKYSRWIGHSSALTAGTEWVSDFSRKEVIRISGSTVNFQQAAVLLGHEFWLGRVTFSQQLGIYYYDQFKASDPVYQRYGLTLALVKKVFIGFNLKTHRHVADFFDVRAGLAF